jgi:hypothetical protein
MVSFDVILLLLLFTVKEDNGDVIVETEDGRGGDVNGDKDEADADEEDGDELDDDVLRKFSNCSITLESNENKSNFNRLF